MPASAPAARPPPARHRARLATVAFVRNGDAVLLLRHAPTSDRFAGLWNGIGGHVEAGEDARAAAHRELLEETGLDVAGLRLRGVMHEEGLLGQAYVVFFFVGESPTRALRPAPGLELVWQPLARLDELALVPDVAALLPRLLDADDVLFATQTYDGGDGSLALRVDAPPRAGRAAGGARA